MNEHPYKGLPNSSFWRRSVSSMRLDQIDPVVEAKIVPIDTATKVASAGSCFAANIAKSLRKAGFNYLTTENLHPAIYSVNPDWWRKQGYGTYSANYGNIYTPLQMYQTLLRAYEVQHPVEDWWVRHDGAVIDPFRPNLPHPANSISEFEALQKQHYSAIRAAFTQAEVFIFTLGLTEAWRSKKDGFVFPVCPGTIEGEFDPARHEFVNFSATEIAQHIIDFSTFLREQNPNLRIILTVSPVPLVATASGNHVIQATIYSKSVLRVAAEMAVNDLPNTAYFPAYEIITGPQAPDSYFNADRRSVSNEGIDHVMRVFFAHFTSGNSKSMPGNEPAPDRQAQLTAAISEAVERACEEELVELNTRRQ